MKDKTKIHILAVLTGVSFICLAGLGYYVWNSKNSGADPSTTIEQLHSSNSLPDSWPKDWDS